MKKRIELIKSLTLFILVCISIMLSFSIVGYKPDYEILDFSQDKKKSKQDFAKLQENTLRLLSPYIIEKVSANIKEEKPIANTITKLAEVSAIKNNKQIQNILKKISEKNIEETRFRNKSISEIIVDNDVYYSFNYKREIDTISSKAIYLGEKNQSTSFDFDRVLITKNKPNILYLYKNEIDTYFQIEYKDEIFKILEDSFKENSKIYSKYSINGKNNFYAELNGEFYTDTYNLVESDIRSIANNIFVGNNNIKIVDRDNNKKEATDGYAIIREGDNFITYINPSIINSTKNLINENDATSIASTFLITGYIPNQNYTFFSISNNEIIYKEVYKDGLVFSKNFTDSQMKVLLNSEGVYNIKYPKYNLDSKEASDKNGAFTVENISEILNYLYSNLKLEYLEDVELGYEKIFKDNMTVVYKPSWYVLYNGEYLKYVDLKDRVKRGRI